MLRLAEKAFWPASIPFPVMHVDTGHNFPEVIEFRDRRVAELGVRLVVASVQEAIDGGRVAEETGPRASRNRLQTVTLLDAIEEHRFDAVFGGARRDEEKARAKERVFSFRDEFGQWDPKNQRPELWSLYNGRHRRGEHIRVFPLSNWTELDIWQYIADGAASSSRRSTTPTSARSSGATACWLAVSAVRHGRGRRGAVEVRTVRYRTVGDASVHRCGRVRRRHGRGGHRRGRGDPAHRAWRHPGRRPGVRGRHGRPQERGVLLMAVRASSCGSPRRARSTTASPRSSGGCSTTRRRSSRTSSRRSSDASERWATSTPTWRCSPTACGPSASRASPSTSPTATSPRPGGSSSSPTPPGTSSTRATWSPVRRPPTWRSCWSTPARACVEQSRRHAFLASLLRIPHLVLCVNKMDLVDCDQDRFEEIKDEFRAFASQARRSPTSPSSRSRRCTATTWSTARRTCPGTRARRCCTTSRRCTSRRTAT